MSVAAGPEQAVARPQVEQKEEPKVTPLILISQLPPQEYDELMRSVAILSPHRDFYG